MLAFGHQRGQDGCLDATCLIERVETHAVAGFEPCGREACGELAKDTLALICRIGARRVNSVNIDLDNRAR